MFHLPSSSRRILPLVVGAIVGGAVSLLAVGTPMAAFLPRLILTSVGSGAVVSGVMPLSAFADATGFTTLQFQVSGQNVGSMITSGACATSWDTRQFANGSHTVTAVARDAVGTAVWATPVVVTVSNFTPDTTAPSVTLTGPTAGTTLTGLATLTATATDNIGVTGVWFTVDGVTIGTEVAPTQGHASLAWLSSLVANGSHALRAVARDAVGNTTISNPITITVRNAGSGIGGDFDLDGYPDLLFQHSDGRLYVWFMNDATAMSQRGLSPASIDPAWKVAAIDDINGDRRTDILFQNPTTGQVIVWYMNGTTRVGEATVQAAGSPWRVATTADIDGDGDSDIIWRHPTTGQVYAWTVQAGLVNGGSALVPASVDLSWQIVGSADINRDGRTDLVWQNTTTGTIYVWYMNGFTMTQGVGTTPASVNPAWRLKAVADLNQNGSPDFIWQHQTTGQLYLWHMNGTVIVDERFLVPGQVAVAWQIVGSL